MRSFIRVLGMLAFMAVGLIIYVLWGQGLFIDVQDDFTGTCTAVAGAPGTEDLTIDHENGIVYLSSMDRAAAAGGLVDQGAVFSLDLRGQGATVVNLTEELGLDLEPHGISLWKSPAQNSGNNPNRLFVINHFGGRHSVEIFEILDTGLKHVQTIHSTAMVSPNDLVAVGRSQFLATNDSHHVGGYKGLAEKMLRLPISNVVYYDGARFTEAIGDMAFPNGINISANGQQLYLASMADGKVYVYNRDPDTSGFGVPVGIDTPGNPDNIEVLPDGTLLVGLHTKMLKLLTSMTDPDALIPSRIVRIDPDIGSVDIIYDNAGGEISAASVASIYGNNLIIGAIADPDVLFCTLP